MILQKLDAWHQSKTGLLVFGIVELALAYLSIIRALDSGSLFDWFLTIILLIGAIQNFVRLLLKVVKHGR